MNPVLVALLVAILGVSAAAQQIWKVHCTGAYGAQFTDLPPAVAAAAPGDEIRVFGTYPAPICPAYSATIITKPLRIVGFTVGTVTSTQPNGVGLRGTMVIVGIPAGQRVVLSSLGIVHEQFPATAGIVAVDCAGDILLEHVGY